MILLIIMEIFHKNKRKSIIILKNSRKCIYSNFPKNMSHKKRKKNNLLHPHPNLLMVKSN